MSNNGEEKYGRVSCYLVTFLGEYEHSVNIFADYYLDAARKAVKQFASICCIDEVRSKPYITVCVFNDLLGNPVQVDMSVVVDEESKTVRDVYSLSSFSMWKGYIVV